MPLHKIISNHPLSSLAWDHTGKLLSRSCFCIDLTTAIITTTKGPLFPNKIQLNWGTVTAINICSIPNLPSCCRQWQQDVTSNTRAMAKLKASAETCKHVLSSRDTATCAIESLYGGVDLNSKVSRYCLDTLWMQKLMTKSLKSALLFSG